MHQLSSDPCLYSFICWRSIKMRQNKSHLVLNMDVYFKVMVTALSNLAVFPQVNGNTWSWLLFLVINLPLNNFLSLALVLINFTSFSSPCTNYGRMNLPFKSAQILGILSKKGLTALSQESYWQSNKMNWKNVSKIQKSTLNKGKNAVTKWTTCSLIKKNKNK